MTNNDQTLGLWRRPLRALALPPLVAIAFAIAACSQAGPPPSLYVLGPPPPATAASHAQTGLPIVELRRVRVPDYLDTTDILEHRGSRLVASTTGRWGERLSIGMSRALGESLATRLPQMVITATPFREPPERQVTVEVAAFEATEDRRIVLVARWTVVDGASRRVLREEQTSLLEAMRGEGDAAVVDAMSHALEALADKLAAGINGDPRAG